MKFVSEEVTEVVDYKAEEDDTMTEDADTAKEEYIMAVVDMEANMAEAVGIIQVTGGADQMQEWCLVIMAQR